ncbi:hypothetical protein [Streptomyces olindensis]|uniref:hypothetical protein n=1 Tax=Streptomyces olindensis TaxID=358823 RepID=UPI0034059754
MSRETDTPSSGPNGRGGAAYPSGTPPYGTPAVSDDGTGADRSAARPEERKTETTLTTRIRINIPGSRPIPPVVVRKPVAEADGPGDTAPRGEAPTAPGGAASRGTGTVESPAEPGQPAEDKPSSDWFAPRKSGGGKGGQGGGSSNGAGLPGGSGPAASGSGAGASGGARPGAGRPGGVVGSMSAPGGSRSGGTNGAGLPGGATGGPVAPGHGGGTGSFDVTEALAAGPLGSGSRPAPGSGGEPRRDDLPYFSENGGGRDAQGGYGDPGASRDFTENGGPGTQGPAGPTGGPVTGDGPMVPPAGAAFHEQNGHGGFPEPGQGGPGGLGGPGGPGGPGGFGEPGGHGGPGGPGVFNEPGGPGGPGGFGEPGGPGGPGAFNEPGGPGRPGAYSKPGGPGGAPGGPSGAPNGPGGPGGPGGYDERGGPGGPGPFGAPGGPGGPGAPGAPGTPGAPSAFNDPGRPGGPGAPTGPGAAGQGAAGPGGGMSDDTAILTPQKPAPEPPDGQGYAPRHDNVSGHTVTSGIPVVPPGTASPFGPGAPGDGPVPHTAPKLPEPAAPTPASSAKAPKKKGRSKLVLLAAGVVVLAGGVYGAGLLMNRTDVPKGTTVLGVDIGGGTRDDAVKKLDEAFDGRVGKELKLSVDGRTVALDPDNAGLQFDMDATADAAAKSDYNPVSVIGSLFGNHRVVTPVMPVDEEKLHASLEDAAGGAGSVTEGTIKFEPGKAVAVYGKAGKGIDLDKSTAAVEEAYRAQVETGTATPVDVPTTTQQPKISNAEVDRMMNKFAKPAMSGIVTVEAGGVEVRFSPQNSLWRFLAVKPVGNKLVEYYDKPALKKLYGGAWDSVLITRGNGKKTPVTPDDVIGAMRQALLGKTAADRVAVIETNPS